MIPVTMVKRHLSLDVLLFCILASLCHAKIPNGIHLITLTAKAPEWSFQSPNFNLGLYPNDFLGVWLIKVDNGSKVIFDFDVLEIDKGDLLEIGNGQDASDLASELDISVITRLTGNLSAEGVRLIAKGNEAWLKFRSNQDTTCRGFSVTVRMQDARRMQEEGFCKQDFQCARRVEGITCLGNESVCDGFEQCKDRSDEANCDSSRYDRFDISSCKICAANQQYDHENHACPTSLPDQQTCTRPSPLCGCGGRGKELGILCIGWYPAMLRTVPDETHSLFLSGINVNKLKNSPFKMFPNLRNLKVLVIQATSGASDLKRNAFDGFEGLTSLVIFDIHLRKIESKAFAGLDQLDTLAFFGKEATSDLPVIEDGAFEDIADKLSYLFVDDYRFCCFFGATIQENCREWFDVPELFSCSQLVPNYVLKVFMWILGISAVVGNILVMVWRCREKVASRASLMINSFLVFNLAAADALMGLYMLIIAGADAFYGSRYFEVSGEWRASAACKVAGFISMVANETSVFFLVFISITRFMFVVFPFVSNRHISLKVVKVAGCIIWLLTVIIAVVSTVLSLDEESSAYGLSDVCIGLPLTTRVTGFEIKQQSLEVGGIDEVTYSRPVPTSTSATWVFSIVLFLGVNLFCFCVILACYISIFVKVKVAARRVRSHNKRDESEVRMAVKMAAIVLTDFLCWIPVIIMGTLFQAGVAKNNPEIFVWSVVFILPINSSINPYLYTFLDICTKKREQKASRRTKVERNEVEATPSKKTTSTSE